MAMKLTGIRSAACILHNGGLQCKHSRPAQVFSMDMSGCCYILCNGSGCDHTPLLGRLLTCCKVTSMNLDETITLVARQYKFRCSSLSGSEHEAGQTKMASNQVTSKTHQRCSEAHVCKQV
jgi:hypothetical protein